MKSSLERNVSNRSPRVSFLTPPQANLLSESIIIISVVGLSNGTTTTNTSERGLCLGSLALLATLFGSLLLLKLLVAESSQGASNLLDLVALEVLGELLGELLEEEGVVRLGRELADHGAKSSAEGLKLGLGGRVEQGQGRDVDGVVGVLGVDLDNGALADDLAVVADADAGKQVLSVLEIGLLLLATEALAALGLGLLLHVRILRQLAGALGLTLGDALRLGLLVGGGFGLSLGLGLGGLLRLLALYLGVLGGIPRVKNVTLVSLLIVEAAAAGGKDGRVGGGRLLLFLVCGDEGLVSLGFEQVVVAQQESRGKSWFWLICIYRLRR